jgi:hypothetical protein
MLESRRSLFGANQILRLSAFREKRRAVLSMTLSFGGFF